MSNKVKDEVIYVRIYDDEPTTTPTVADVVASPGFELSMEGNGLQEFNLPKTAETRDTTGRHGYMKSETRGVIDYEGDFVVDWVTADGAAAGFGNQVSGLRAAGAGQRERADAAAGRRSDHPGEYHRPRWRFRLRCDF